MVPSTVSERETDETDGEEQTTVGTEKNLAARRVRPDALPRAAWCALVYAAWAYRAALELEVYRRFWVLARGTQLAEGARLDELDRG